MKTTTSPPDITTSEATCAKCKKNAIAWLGMEKTPLCAEHTREFLRERIQDGLKPDTKQQ